MKTSENASPGFLDPKNTTLLVIDVQRELFDKSSPIYNAEGLLRNINTLVDRAHRSGVPVFYVQHSNKKDLVYGSEGWQLHSQLHPVEGDRFVHKQHGNAFQDTDLDEALKSRNIDSLILTGLVTHGCVRATSIGAKKLGYEVILVKDGHSNYSKKAAQIIEEWNQKLNAESVELASTAEIKFD